jgi:hypothetical protein
LAEDEKRRGALCYSLHYKSRLNPHDLKPYLGEEDEVESRMTQMQEGEDDVNINTSDTSTPTHNQISGLITQDHERQLNN